MQKRIDLSLFHRKFLLGGIRVFQRGVVLRVLQNPGQRHGLHWRKDFILTMFGPGFREKLAHLIAGRIEHTNRAVKTKKRTTTGVGESRDGMIKIYDET